ncbi:hypothetical protein GCM10010198_22550 [Nocardia seriolae]|nr:hypothetical protein NS2_02950 [Nocardia seriolae NBRC 15557]
MSAAHELLGGLVEVSDDVGDHTGRDGGRQAGGGRHVAHQIDRIPVIHPNELAMPRPLPPLFCPNSGRESHIAAIFPAGSVPIQGLLRTCI